MCIAWTNNNDYPSRDDFLFYIVKQLALALES